MKEEPEAVIENYNDAPAACKEYDPRATEVARIIGKMIRKRMLAAAVEHIGSTAVPGCAGKGIVDLLLVYPESELESAKATLDELGFQRQTSRDPFPETRPMRVGSLEYQGKVFNIHVHVISDANAEADDLLAFRDRLREDSRLRVAYVALKREIIDAGITDSVDYSLAKGEFVKGAIERE
jgi:GrpB-like predicted nucleotidyltransferase (UPF0157 family)